MNNNKIRDRDDTHPKNIEDISNPNNKKVN